MFITPFLNGVDSYCVFLSDFVLVFLIFFFLLSGLSEFVGSVTQSRTDVWKNSQGHHDNISSVYFSSYSLMI